VTDSVAYWGKLVAMKQGIPYISSTTTFAFNRYSAKYMKNGIMETVRMLLEMPRINKQIRRLQEKGYPEQGAVAKRTEELGAGLRLTSIVKEDILAAIQRATSDASYKQNAERISESFKQCGGIEEAVAFIEKVGKITH